MRIERTIRVRPAIGPEIGHPEGFSIPPSDDQVVFASNTSMTLHCDRVIRAGLTQSLLFKMAIQHLVDDSLLEGIRPAVLVMGPESSGKTYTTEGLPQDPSLRGLLYTLIAYLRDNDASSISVACIGFPATGSPRNLLAADAVTVTPVFDSRTHPSVLFPGCSFGVKTDVDLTQFLRRSRKGAAALAKDGIQILHKLWLLSYTIRGSSGHMALCDVSLLPSPRGCDGQLRTLLNRIVDMKDHREDATLPLRDSLFLHSLRDFFDAERGVLSFILCLSSLTTEEDVYSTASFLTAVFREPCKQSALQHAALSGASVDSSTKLSDSQRIYARNSDMPGVSIASSGCADNSISGNDFIAAAIGKAEESSTKADRSENQHSGTVENDPSEKRSLSMSNPESAVCPAAVLAPTASSSPLPTTRSHAPSSSQENAELRQKVRGLECLLKEALLSHEAQIEKTERLQSLLTHFSTDSKVDISRIVDEETRSTNQRLDAALSQLADKETEIYRLHAEIRQLKGLLNTSAAFNAYIESCGAARPTGEADKELDSRIEHLVISCAEKDTELRTLRRTLEETQERTSGLLAGGHETQTLREELASVKGLCVERMATIDRLASDLEASRTDAEALRMHCGTLEKELFVRKARDEEVEYKATKAEEYQRLAVEAATKARSLETKLSELQNEARWSKHELEVRATTIETLARQVGYFKLMERTYIGGASAANPLNLPPQYRYGAPPCTSVHAQDVDYGCTGRNPDIDISGLDAQSFMPRNLSRDNRDVCGFSNDITVDPGMLVSPKCYLMPKTEELDEKQQD